MSFLVLKFLFTMPFFAFLKVKNCPNLNILLTFTLFFSMV